MSKTEDETFPIGRKKKKEKLNESPWGLVINWPVHLQIMCEDTSHKIIAVLIFFF